MNSTYVCTDFVPKYYTITLTLLAGISFPINCTGVWLVWFHSPQMGKFKYCLMYLQIATFTSENWCSLVPGYYFFPMIAGHNLSYIGTIIGGQMTMVVWAFFFCFELPALFNCFMYRHEAAIGISNTTNSLRYPNLFVLFVAHLLPPFTAVTLQLSLLTYDQKYNLLKSKYPSCINFANDTLFEIYDWNVNPWIAISGIGILTFVLVVAAYGFGIVFHTMHILHKLRVHMSVETFKMHKNALISLSMQCLIPSIFLIVPICTVFIIIVNNMTEFQELSNCSFFGFTSHSCVSTIIMITTNARYSTTVKHKISQVVCQGKSSSVPVIIPLSMTNVQN